MSEPIFHTIDDREISLTYCHYDSSNNPYSKVPFMTAFVDGEVAGILRMDYIDGDLYERHVKPDKGKFSLNNYYINKPTLTKLCVSNNQEYGINSNYSGLGIEEALIKAMAIKLNEIGLKFHIELSHHTHLVDPFLKVLKAGANSKGSFQSRSEIDICTKKFQRHIKDATEPKTRFFGKLF